MKHSSVPCAVHSYHNHHHYKVIDPTVQQEPPRTGLISPSVWEPGIALVLSSPRQAAGAIWQKCGEDYVA